MSTMTDLISVPVPDHGTHDFAAEDLASCISPSIRSHCVTQTLAELRGLQEEEREIQAKIAETRRYLAAALISDHSEERIILAATALLIGWKVRT